MDVLSLLKRDHDQIQCLLEGFNPSASGDDLRSVLTPLKAAMSDLMKIEADYLFPEVGDLFTGADVIVDRAMARQTEISATLLSLKEVLADKNVSNETLMPLVAEISRLIGSHIKDQQDLLIPRIRKLIPTQDREDLAEVFMEAKRELGIGISAF